MKDFIDKVIPYFIGLLIFVIVTVVYFYPAIEGKNIMGDDNSSTLAMSKEIIEHREKYGDNPMWTNGLFGGMPGYQISFGVKDVVLTTANKIFNFLGRPFSFLFLYLICFYILLISLRVKHWIAIVGAISFAFSSYSIIIIMAGHSSKAVAIGYLAGVIASIIIAFNNKRILGAILLAIFLGLQIKANHYQITYYGLILVFLFGFVELIFSIKEKEVARFLKNVGALMIAVVFALLLNITSLWTTYEYAKQTIRGPSELSSNTSNKTTGLDKDYVVQWSYGIDETMTLLIPGFMGNASQINPGVDSESFKILQKNTRNARQNIQAVSMYHGEQPSTSGPVYFGAIVVFLFVLGLFLVKGRYKWWLLIATIISIVLSWGGNIMWLTSFLLDYLPLYNKFRAPSMILVIAQFTVPLLGFLALDKILKSEEVSKKEFLNGLKWSTIIVGGITLVFALVPSLAGDFQNPFDTARLPDWLIDAVHKDRRDLLRNDAFRSFVFIALASGILYLWYLNKIKLKLFIGILGLLILIDLWGVDKRFLNESHFKTKRQIETPFPETIADKEILKDKDISYRVLPVYGNPFMDARASYYHKNVGGYHAAKLRRYQELITYHIQPEINELFQGIRSNKKLEEVLPELGVINMLNTRYLIFDLNKAPLKNSFALGNAWFVNGFQIVDNADKEITTLRVVNPKEIAVIDKRFEKYVKGKVFKPANNSNIVLTDYKSNHLTYRYNSDAEQLTVFSEIFYDKGWKAFVDGEEFPHFRVDYVLRAMVIPQGEHVIEFKFEPQSYFLGNMISNIATVVFLILIVVYLFVEIKKKRINKKNLIS